MTRRNLALALLVLFCVPVFSGISAAADSSTAPAKKSSHAHKKSHKKSKAKKHASTKKNNKHMSHSPNLAPQEQGSPLPPPQTPKE